MPPLSHFVSFRPTPCSKERLSRRLLQNTPESWALRQRRSLTAMACTPPWLFPMPARTEEHTSELQSLMRISYAVFCLKKQRRPHTNAIRQDRNTTETNKNESIKKQQT